jgi:hypothetical protein
MGERRKAVFIRCKPPYQWYAQHYIEQPNASNVPPLRICVEPNRMQLPELDQEAIKVQPLPKIASPMACLTPGTDGAEGSSRKAHESRFVEDLGVWV